IYLDSDFTFTENIYEPLVVIADNIVIDGNGYELQGGSGFGIYLNGRTNVTIKNIKLGKWSYVIFLYLSSNITISGNTMLKLGGDLIKLDSSSNNTICKNIVDESTYIAYFIELWYSSNNNIFENSILPWFGDSPGIILWDSSNNKIYGNNISNINSGIILNDFSNNNSISGNILTNLHSEAISIDYYSSNNNISENIIRNTWAGILIGYFSENNRVFRNTITVITGWVGYSAVVFVYYTSNNFIYENNITSDYTAYGFWLLSASYNNISRNTITNCYIGIYLSDSVENIIYHNNIMNNLDQVSDENPGNNHWYHPDLLEGNYWSDYPGVDDGSGLDKHAIADDGIGDTEIPWPGLDYDYYPLMHPLLLTPTGTNVEVIDPITGVNITFPEVISSGITTVSKSDSGPSPPAGYRVSGVYYEISTTATYIGSMIIGIPYDESQIHGKEENLKLMHYDPVYGWTEITGKVDTVNNIIYGWEPELSIFAIMEPYIEATIDIDPDTLNLKSKGKFITAYIELQEGYDVCNIDISTVMIQESIPAAPSPTDIADYDDDGIPDLMVKFDRTSVQLSLSPGEAVEITIDGSLIDGTYFSGTAYIRVIDKGNEHIDEEDPSSIA
ncbi:MAG: nitrous oxide reductase family maturation protein NosD, partial [Promethearchaeota archaeon]